MNSLLPFHRCQLQPEGVRKLLSFFLSSCIVMVQHSRDGRATQWCSEKVVGGDGWYQVDWFPLPLAQLTQVVHTWQM